MTINETFAESGARLADESPEPYSAAWWESRTAEELRDIIKRGFAGADAFRGAVAETERRARAATTRLREEAAAQAVRRMKFRKILVGSVAVSGLAIVTYVGMWLIG